MFFAADALTDPAAQAAANQVVQAAVRYDVIAITAVISVLATSGLGGFFFWLWNRKKTNSDVAVNTSEIDANESQVDVNESVIIQNQYNVIAGLQKDIERFMERTRGLADQVDAIKAEKKAADLAIDDARTANLREMNNLISAFEREKLKIAESVNKAIDAMSRLEVELDKCENPNEIKRHSVLIVELLYYVRRQLIME